MEARLMRAALLAAAVLSLGAGYRTQNFVVGAATPQLAQEVAQAAESYRSTLAREWLGRELPPWRDPCPITVQVGPQLGAGGATTFMFDQGHPFGWSMSIQGSRERLLDSVLPHEITHTIFATHFGRPLPRWADEGACTTVEHVTEKTKQQHLLINFLTTGRGIAFNRMFAMTEYPSDVLPLYAQGYSLARFLIAQRGKPHFVNYVGDGMRWNDWPRATRTHYGYKDLSELQLAWLDWVRQGSPAIRAPETLVAQQDVAGSSGGDRAAATELVPVRVPAPLANGAAAPPLQLAALDAPVHGGWYSRVRDKNAALRADGPPPPTSRAGAATQTLSHPQPIERPRATVLEWSPASNSAYLAPAPTGAMLR